MKQIRIDGKLSKQEHFTLKHRNIVYTEIVRLLIFPNFQSSGKL